MARAGYRTGCATGSEQDMVPEVVRKTPMTGSQTRCVYRARAKLRIEKDVTPELDREQGQGEQDVTPEVDRKRPRTGSQAVYDTGSYRARASVRIGTDVTPEVDREWLGWSF